MSSHDEKMPPRSLKVRIVRPYFDNVVVHEPGAEITLADAQAFSITAMEWVDKPAPEPVAPRIEPPKPEAARIETPQIEAATIETPKIKTPTIKTPTIDSGVTAAALRKREYRKRKREREQAKATRKKRDAPSIITAPPAAEAATPAALLESSRRRLDHSLPLCGVRKGEVPSSHEGDGVDPLRHRKTVTPPPLTGEEGDSELALPSNATPASQSAPTSEPTPPSGNESAASPAPSGAEGGRSAPQDTSAPSNVT